MPAGDAQRVWYPEMLEALRDFWVAGMPPWREVIAFCDRMTAMRKELAVARDIKPPMMTCHDCGTRARAAYPTISVRSLIFALRKVDAVSDDQMKEIDRDWKRYRRQNKLDANGHVTS